MKKICLLLMSLMPLSLLTSCGEKPLHTVKFSGTDCILNTADGKKFTEGKYQEGTELNFTFLPVRGHANPTDNEVQIVNAAGKSFTNYNYNSKDAKLNITLTDDIVITASTTEKERICTVTLVGDNNIQIQEQVSYRKGDFSPITVPYTITNGFTIDSTVVNPSHTLEYIYSEGSEGFNLVITPNDDSTDSQIKLISSQRTVSLYNSDASTLEIKECRYLPDSVEIDLTVKEERQNKYRIPPDDQYFKILASDGSEPSFTYQRLTDFSAKITISDVQPVRTKTYIIKATDYLYYFEITSIDFGLFMESPDLPKPALVERGHNLVFTLKIKGEPNTSTHTIPHSLSIKLSDGTLLPKEAYQIDCSTDPYRQNAKVTIYARYITDDFSIAGVATEANYFEWDILVCGAQVEGDYDQDGYMFGASIQEIGKTFSISGDEVSTSTITRERVIIEDLDRNLYRLSDTDCPDQYKNFTITDSGANTVTLSTGTYPYNYVGIYVSVPGFEFFSKLSWTTINKFAENGWHETFFRVGDTKKVKVADITYDARIIGFNHDELTSKTGTASMTIEFAQVITKNNGDAYFERFDERVGEDYRGGIYDNYLQNVFFPMFPLDLQSCIKQVSKPVLVWNWDDTREMQSCDTKIFPLSLAELNLTSAFYWDAEGSVYPYYADCPADKRIKKTCKVVGSGIAPFPVGYWSRSILQGDDYHQAYYIKDSGTEATRDYVYNKFGYTVAFCI
ncbi:MAG: DUF6273 domain-containing protein [Bacilli bacterium]|nr:DUF6273 domain-containing protein [Bacilli bacterium]